MPSSSSSGRSDSVVGSQLLLLPLAFQLQVETRSVSKLFARMPSRFTARVLPIDGIVDHFGLVETKVTELVETTKRVEFNSNASLDRWASGRWIGVRETWVASGLSPRPRSHLRQGRQHQQRLQMSEEHDFMGNKLLHKRALRL